MTSSPVLAYRFALLLTGDGERARDLVRETLNQDGERFDEIRESHRLAWLVARLRERAKCQGAIFAEKDPTEAVDDLGRLLAAFSRLNEQERSALGLFYLGGFGVEEIGGILGKNLKELGEILCAARTGIRSVLEGGQVPETTAISEIDAYLACYRKGGDLPKAVQRVEAAAARDLILGERLRVQSREDDKWMAVLGSVEIPDGLDWWSNEAEQPTKARQWMHPAVLSVLAGLVMITGCLGWLWMERRRDFQGRDFIQEMVGSVRTMSGNEMQPTQLMVGELGDVLYMRGFEGYRVWPGLAKQRAVGCRVFKMRGVPVAQVAVDAQSSLLYLFRSTELGVQVPELGKWTVLECGDLTAAVREDTGVCSVLSIRGHRSQMEEFLKTLKP
jgi:DNA-directed RNA polymerase specialized sigma24 family protein